MKKVLVIAALCIVAALGVLWLAYNKTPDGTKHISYELTPGLNSMQVSWDRTWGVRNYEIYRADLTTAADHDEVPFDAYELAGRVTGLHATFEDIDAKPGHCYGYVVRGFGKGGRSEAPPLVCDSYREDATTYDWVGLMKPDLINSGYGENETNDPEHLYLYVQCYGGVAPEGVEFYRAPKGSQDFAQVELEKFEGDGIDCSTWVDTSMKPGGAYVYKARTTLDDQGELIRSSWSEPVTLYAVNFKGTYKVKKIGATNTEVSVKMISDPYNGTLTLKPGKSDLEDQKQMVIPSRYSKDGKIWKTIPADGVKLVGGQTLYVQFAGSDLADRQNLLLNDQAVDYEIGVGGWTSLELDLKKGSGSSFTDYDN